MSEKRNCESLAPVGERRISASECEVEVVGYYQGMLVYVEVETGHVEMDHEYNLSPIRTAEEVAVEAMIKVFDDSPGPSMIDGINGIYAAIRDGEIPGVKLDDGEGEV